MNASDPVSVKAQGILTELRSQREQEDLRQIVSTPVGRRFVRRLLDETGPLQNAMTGNANTYFILGKQEVGKKLMSQLLTEMPEIYTKLVQEAKAEAANDQAVAKRMAAEAIAKEE